MNSWGDDIPKKNQGKGNSNNQQRNQKSHQHHNQPKVIYKEVVPDQEESKGETTSQQQQQHEPQPYEDLDLLVRAKEGVYVINTNTKTYDPTSLKKLSGSSAGFCFANKGSYVACIQDQCIAVYSLPNYEEYALLQQPQGIVMGFSCTDKFLSVVSKLDKDNCSLVIWNVELKTKVADFPYGKVKRENWPITYFSPGDKYMFRTIGKNKLEIYSCDNAFSLLHTQEYTAIDKIAISPLQNRLIFASFAQEHVQGYEHTQAFIQFQEFTGEKLTDLQKKNLNKADQVDAIWSPDGLNCFVWSQSAFDNTGKSYYGEHQLHLFNISNKLFKQIPTYEGPIHDLIWNPNSQDFIVISGFMPSGTVFFDKNLNAKYEFGKNHRSVIKWSNLSRFALIAGFGNLAGDIDIWDTFLTKKVGTCKANSTASCSWSPDSRRFVTAVLTPRLRVDNELKIWKHNGQLLNRVDFGKTELYEVGWVPSKITFKDRAASPPPKEEVKSAQEKPKRLFVMPGNSASLSAMIDAEKKSQTSGGKAITNFDLANQAKESQQRKVPGAKMPEPKKKRVRKKKTDQGEEDDKEDP